MTRSEFIMEKIAEVDNRPEAGYWAKNMSATRAMRRSDTGIGVGIAKNDLVKKRLKASFIGPEALIGTAIGAGVGLATSAYGVHESAIGALAGGLAGNLIGGTIGSYKADKKYLAEKGIDKGFWGIKSMTDGAKQKYLLDKYRGGGYKKQ